jgi:hypothetical protein
VGRKSSSAVQPNAAPLNLHIQMSEIGENRRKSNISVAPILKPSSPEQQIIIEERGQANSNKMNVFYLK